MSFEFNVFFTSAISNVIIEFMVSQESCTTNYQIIKNTFDVKLPLFWHIILYIQSSRKLKGNLGLKKKSDSILCTMGENTILLLE